MRHKILSLTDQIDQFVSFENYSEKKTNLSKLNEYKNIVQRIINNELTGRQRECITLRFYKNLSAQDISNMLGIDKTTVYKHIRVGLKNIKKSLKIYFDVYSKP